jgi:hypothetical protein
VAGLHLPNRGQMLKLRDYQQRMKQEVYSYIKQGVNKILVVSTTGSGKTELATAITMEALSKSRKVAFLVHRDNLVRQTVARFSKVLDQAGNTVRHGFIEDYSPSDFDLRQSGNQEKGDPPVKECPECGCLHRTFDMTCPECGYEYPIKDKVKQESNLVELRKVDEDLPLIGSLYRSWKKEAYQKKIAPGYAMAKFKELHPDRWPDRNWNLHAVFANPTHDDFISYMNYLVNIAEKKEKDSAWMSREFINEFGFHPSKLLTEEVN